jgi:cytochrome c-type biogenesis protein
MTETLLIVPAFVAGLLTFLAPCTLPLVPAYLSFISGSARETNPSRKRVLMNGLLFVLGFSVVFILFGVFAGVLGGLFFEARIWIARVGGVFVILFGLMMLNILRIPFLMSEKRIHFTSPFERGTPLNSGIMGIVFGAGWTPCVGPVLGSVLLLAGTSATALSGAFLLAVFSLGLAIPFLVVALGLSRAERTIVRFDRFLHVSSVIGGIFLIVLGVLLLTDNMNLLISYGYRALQFLHYDALINYL